MKLYGFGPNNETLAHKGIKKSPGGSSTSNHDEVYFQNFPNFSGGFLETLSENGAVLFTVVFVFNRGPLHCYVSLIATSHLLVIDSLCNFLFALVAFC